MKYIRLGNTGLKVSRICLGTMTYGSPQWREWVLLEEESRPFVVRALEAGINFFSISILQFTSFDTRKEIFPTS
ncbi:MAG: hypothetical protein JOZ78_22435 [Chroococcidiopsidaceae cyanobacterium CP_BM_ER_R8_30]|nr:hypothetical protein [Chroococcidiopsidaceae cyanobacterium CP_BM_ER_R8_30]